MTRRLLAVHAHPDDESSKGAATSAFYLAQGAEVMVVSCTGGERGDVLWPGLDPRAMADRDMAGHRRYEMARAQQVLGVQHRWLGYTDSGLPPEGEPLPANCFAVIPLEHSAAPLVKLIREFRPQVLVTYDENGGYPHPDHIRTHEVSMFAVDAAADPSRYPEAGEAWQVSKVYYDRGFNSSRIGALADALVAADADSPLLEEIERMRGWMGERPDTSTTHVPCGEFFAVRDDALRAHASQVPPDSSFFFWPIELQQQAWPYEDYELVRSLVESTLPESDLFAGVVTESAQEAQA
ncbi:mycothiol S-conjugate amidase [Homoserinimonas aerilata]|uniref:Mycothiol S-conjugate amidase n=1 Tax=Homoserinimonas aerilata TaxID=1162970 RepID=A0A542YGR1_9MICO|nr:mycothiol conjugate amidase Mca [Homoserinimonas aerilata]TQL47288.1 mycothiol S-conjugate amidase [Homoserinimonas aerilata]